MFTQQTKITTLQMALFPSNDLCKYLTKHYQFTVNAYILPNNQKDRVLIVL
jgi:hypothetical protein